MLKRLLLLLILIFSFSSILFAMDASTIYYATDSELENMSKLRGLDISDSASMRKALYEYEGLDAYSVKEEDSSEYSLSIISAESLEKDDSSLIISGNACISLSTKGGSEKMLRAGQIIVDIENKQITALENVSFFDKADNAVINEIDADIISVFWESEVFYITDAATSSKRKNSEGDEINFYTSGEKLTYFPDGGIMYEDGFISSDPVNRYSSINADNIAMLPGGDMFISNAYLSIGRVPVLYLPFFFFPGSRILGNPAFGFDSSKGAFLNTTFEILGSSPDVDEESGSSSFTAILKSSEESGDVVPVGFYYDVPTEQNKSQLWAKESESYISILADAYSGSNFSNRLSSGLIHLGLDSKINLFKKKLKIVIQDGIGFSNPANNDIRDSIFRFYGNNSISYSDYGLDVEASFPFYSDNYVLYDMKNRLVGFSLDPILGQDPEFPTNYSSSLSSFNRSFDISYRLPSKYTNKYLSNLNLSSLRIKSIYNWDYTPKTGGYKLSEFEKPYMNFSISGAFYDYSNTVEHKKDDKSEENVNIHMISDPLLAPLYKEEDKSRSGSSSSRYSSSLKYNISEDLKFKDSYNYGKLSSSSFDSTTSGRFTFDANISQWLSISDSITPSYTFSYVEKYSNEISNIERQNKVTMNNDLKVSIPYLGISYNLSMKLVDNKTVESWRSDVPSSYKENSSFFSPKWDKDSVRQHQIAFSKSFDTPAGTFSPSISYTLKPLIGAIQPKLGYRFGPFSTAFAWKFLEEKENQYKSDLVELSFGYNGTYLVYSSAMKYQSAKFSSNDFFLPLSWSNSLTVKSKDNKWAITEFVDYSVYSEKTNSRNYFNAIKTTLSTPFGSLSLNWKTQDNNSKVEFNDIALNLRVNTDPFQFWKGRIYLKFGLESSFLMNMNSLQSTSFSITPSITFSIAEFLDFKFSINSYNNNFYSYFDNDTFRFDWMFQDLFRSFDFFGTGREHTNFLMRNASLEVVHYMEDWDLHCKYSTEFVQSGNVYTLMPKFSIYLSWKTLPDLKVDEKWKQTQGTNGKVWVRE